MVEGKLLCKAVRKEKRIKRMKREKGGETDAWCIKGRKTRERGPKTRQSKPATVAFGEHGIRKAERGTGGE